ncbi:MAG: hypothetical protein ACXVZP_12430, partial [Gaiellaceae bacterium]
MRRKPLGGDHPRWRPSPRAAAPTRQKLVGVRSMTILALIAVGLLISGAASAVPSSPTDQTKVPHYFGPYPNWANSPLTLPDATVAISGDGTGATATAQVGANGAVTGLTITNPGSNYTTATVAISGSGTGATADAVVQASGSVTGVTVDQAGGGYTA